MALPSHHRQPRPSTRSRGTAARRPSGAPLITRPYTADGLVSEVYTGDTDAEQDLILDIVHNELAPALIGVSATNPEGCWLAMQPSTYDILRDRNLPLQAIACLDAAIWDV